MDFSEMTYPHDHWEEARHWGAIENGQVVGIVSIYPENKEGIKDLKTWRLRGMAVEAHLQGKGVGRLLVDAALEFCRQQGVSTLWCNARTPAIPFYEKLGFVKVGQEFVIDNIGPHFIAEIKL